MPGRAALALLFCTFPASAQVQWTRAPGALRLVSRFDARVAYDAARSRVILFGGNNFDTWFRDTWEWDGSAWIERFPATIPPGRSGHGMAWDAVRGRIVMFGGVGQGGTALLGDTWEWDGTDWTQRTPPVSPSPRWSVAMTYDAARRVTVLFGGGATTFQAPPAPDAHWEWDGTTWSQGPAGPPVRFAAGLAWDSARNRTVLFGGAAACMAFTCPTFGDTWEHDGAAWTRVATTGAPARTGHSTFYDPLRAATVVTGGQSACFPACSTVFGDTWEWNGSSWTQGAARPWLGHSGAAIFDVARTRAILFGGWKVVPFISNTLLAETWAGDATGWNLVAPEPMPKATPGQPMVYDSGRGRVMLFQNALPSGSPGLPQTWEWDGQSWAQRFPANSPPARVSHGLAYDSRRGRTVLFAGQLASGTIVNDTWEWDGNDWSQRSPATNPRPQVGPAMAYDAARGVTVLYPGGFEPGPLWEWDGTDWTLRSPAANPPARLYPALAYDPARRRIVLFGGVQSPVNHDDTWEYDGTTWIDVSPAVRPPGRTYASAVFDVARGRTVLFGGSVPGGPPMGDLWEWDGTRWTQRLTAETPLPRTGPGMAHDAARSRTVLFGGRGQVGYFQDTWELLAPCDRAGPGQVDSGGLRVACSAPPRVGTSFCITFSHAPPQGAGFHLLLIAPGPCLNPPPVFQPPAVCAASYVHALPIAVLATTGNPASFCVTLPPNPVLAGTPFCVQGDALETGGCFRATDGLVIVLQP